MQFHEKIGYNLVGKIEACGYKFNRWYSTLYMDKFIGTPTDTMLPTKNFSDVKNKFDL